MMYSVAALFLTLAIPTAGPAEPKCKFGETEKCEAWCERGDAGSCYLFARSLSSGIEVPVDHARADLLFIDACRSGYGDACNAVGVGLRSDTMMTAAIWAMVKPYYEIGCEYGSSKACNNLAALIRYTGDGPATDWVKHFERSCELGVSSSTTGCTEAGKALRDGRGGIAIDKTRASELFARGCRLGSTRLCTMASTLGKDVGVTPGESFRAREARCGLGARRDCMDLANALENGVGTRKDPGRALYYWELTCPTEATHYESWACYRLGKYHLWGDGGSVDAEAALRPLQLGCRFGEADACRALGDMSSTGQGTAVSLQDARRYYGQACEIEAPIGCHQAGALAKVTGAPSQKILSEMLFADGCANGDQQSCRALGAGFPELVARAKSVRTRRKADECTKNGGHLSCWDAAVDAWANGEKIESVRYAELACRGGHARGCEWFGNKHLSSPDKYPKGLWAHARACALGTTKPCKMAKRLLEKERDSIDAETLKTASDALAEACAGGFSAACRP